MSAEYELTMKRIQAQWNSCLTQLSTIFTLNKTVMCVCMCVCVCVFVYNSRNNWPILMRFFLLDCKKQWEWHGQKKYIRSIKLTILRGKSIVLATRGPHRQNKFGKAVIAMRGPQIEYVFGKAVIDNVYTLPRFARTSVKQCIFQDGDWK